MGRIRDIITKARDTLADNGERWPDDRLLRLIDEGQLDIAKHSLVLKAQANLLPVQDQAVYDLPDDAWLLTRATYNGVTIGLLTHTEMDSIIARQVTSSNNRDLAVNTSPNSDFGALGECWELDEGSTVKALIYDRRNMGEIRFYPIPNNEPITYAVDTYGVIVTVDDTLHTFSSDYGIVVGWNDPSRVEVIDEFGFVVGIAVTEGIVHIWYIKIPETLASLDSELELPKMWDTALKYYVIFNAFNDDNDARFEQKSKAAASLYERELNLIANTSSLNHVHSGKKRQTSYKGGFSE
jgi:hypothetical protein